MFHEKHKNTHLCSKQHIKPHHITVAQQLKPLIFRPPGSVKSRIHLAEQVRSAYWNGRDEEEMEEDEAEVENRPMNTLSRPEPMELDSNPTQAYCATPRRLSSSSVESAKVPPDEEDKKTLAAADSTVKGTSK